MLYHALFSTAYYGLFGVGELTCSPHVVKAADMHIGINKKRIMFVLQSSKTHSKSDLPQKIKITSASLTSKSHTKKMVLENFCPYNLLRKFLAVRPPQQTVNEQFFVFSDSSPVSPSNFRTCLKTVLELARINSNDYSTHSFPIGRGCDLIKLGVSVETIKHLGRWQSNAVFAYLKN